MLPIQRAIAPKLQSLEKNCHPDTNLKGICRSEWFFTRIIRKVLNLQNSRTEAIAQQFLAAMQSLDFVPINIDIDGEIRLKNQVIQYKAWLETSEKVEKVLRNHKSKRFKELSAKVEAQRVGIMYRLEQYKLEENPNEDLLREVKSLANKWKKQHPRLKEYYVTDREKKKLEKLCQYQHYCKILLKSPSLQDSFFKWIIRDNNDVDSFIQYAAVIDWLGPIITKKTNGIFEIRDKDGVKELTLPFEYKRKNLLRKRQYIKMAEGYKLPFRDILNCFHNENIKIGNFEFFSPNERGFTNFHICKFASFNGKKYEEVDVTKDEWWAEVPVAEQFSVEEAKDLIGDEMDGEKWGILIRASRTDIKMRNIDGTHGWLAFLVPVVDSKGSIVYNAYNFGKFAKKFPLTIWQLLKFFGNTEPADIELDKNIFYSWRQKTHYGVAISPDHGKYGFSLVADSIREARKGKLVFQFQSNGCAKWVQEIFNATIKKAGYPYTNCYEGKVVKSIPTQFPISVMHKSIRLSPKPLQNFMTRLMMYPFFPWRQYNGFSLTKSNMWNSKKLMRFCNPTVLFERQIKEAKGLRKKNKPTLTPNGVLPGFLREIKTT